MIVWTNSGRYRDVIRLPIRKLTSSRHKSFWKRTVERDISTIFSVDGQTHWQIVEKECVLARDIDWIRKPFIDQYQYGNIKILQLEGIMQFYLFIFRRSKGHLSLYVPGWRKEANFVGLHAAPAGNRSVLPATWEEVRIPQNWIAFRFAIFTQASRKFFERLLSLNLPSHNSQNSHLTF